MPRDPAIEVSNCCVETDLCMGNGLCLGLDVNNALRLGSHGLEWPFSVTVRHYPHVWPCRFSFKAPYCLGENASCFPDESEGRKPLLKKFSGSEMTATENLGEMWYKDDV
ncbi:hypothetical protein F4782DRAFT_515106 [Xylaria castorea]|nr:hypothetical protein F4782DRAFT_515106 [Xylaria castorea]